jgi:hypothetical protein
MMRTSNSNTKRRLTASWLKKVAVDGWAVDWLTGGVKQRRCFFFCKKNLFVVLSFIIIWRPPGSYYDHQPQPGATTNGTKYRHTG